MTTEDTWLRFSIIRHHLKNAAGYIHQVGNGREKKNSQERQSNKEQEKN